MTLQAAYQALTDDAGKWDATSKVLSDSAATVAGLTLTSEDFSWIGPLTGLTDSYSETRTHVEEILRAGAAETHRIATTLLKVRSIYEGSDTHARDGLHGVWDPIA